jgi:hypothetical protein
MKFLDKLLGRKKKPEPKHTLLHPSVFLETDCDLCAADEVLSPCPIIKKRGMRQKHCRVFRRGMVAKKTNH